MVQNNLGITIYFNNGLKSIVLKVFILNNVNYRIFYKNRKLFNVQWFHFVYIVERKVESLFYRLSLIHRPQYAHNH